MVALGLLSVPLGFLIYLEPDHPWWGAMRAFAPTWMAQSGWMPQWNQYVWFTAIKGNVLAFAAIPAFMIPLKIAGEGIGTQHAGLQYALLMSVSNVGDTVN